MNHIVEILMRREGIDMYEAWDMIKECQEEMEDAIRYGDYQACEDILASYLGLEPDYLDYFLF